eukprot:TRINITY_DN17741_c0_g1_i1.p1 TRINITY_DN17741_c0_g1~~TRINITY_DN17741_c0_g1_i1.p1  ORF type:complete len:350 (+),score=51.30 TRINITY_DN17741_c0_g1_i1:95-1144(+)
MKVILPKLHTPRTGYTRTSAVLTPLGPLSARSSIKANAERQVRLPLAEGGRMQRLEPEPGHPRHGSAEVGKPILGVPLHRSSVSSKEKSAWSRSTSTGETAPDVDEALAGSTKTPRSARSSVSKTESLGARSQRLAKVYHLDFFEVKNILQELANVSQGRGQLTISKFAEFLSRVFHNDHIPQDISSSIYAACIDQEKKELDVSFLEWYMANLFTTVSQLKGDERLCEENQQTEELSKQIGVSEIEFTKIRKIFGKYDADRSGVIDYKEFEPMIMDLMGAGQGDVHKDRLQSFWRELDTDGSGGIDFMEFLIWYMTSFRASTGSNPDANIYSQLIPLNKWRQDEMSMLY